MCCAEYAARVTGLAGAVHIPYKQAWSALTILTDPNNNRRFLFVIGYVIGYDKSGLQDNVVFITKLNY